MKKIILFGLSLLAGTGLFAQQETPATYKLYGFIRNYAVFDTREVNAGTQDLYFYMPKDEKLVDGTDMNAVPTFRMFSLTTRLGLNVSGYQFGDMKVGGAVEADFYCMNGSVATLRMRQAYVGLTWDDVAGHKLLLNVGQTWHPMAVDMPHITNLETGAPFNPFNRSPQVMAHYSLGKATLTGGFIFPMQFLPIGPDGKSVNYNKYGLVPEMYLGVAYASGGFTGKVGVDLFTSKPRYTKGLSDRLVAVSPFVFGQYTQGKFQIKAKSILAQSGEHMNLLSGYGVSKVLSDGSYEYTPMRDWASFISCQYGKKVQFLATVGYMKQLGTTKDLVSTDLLWINTSAATSINEAFRFTPTIAWNIGKLTVSIEYNATAARFGRGERNARGLYGDGKWILNNRIENMVKFNF